MPESVELQRPIASKLRDKVREAQEANQVSQHAQRRAEYAQQRVEDKQKEVLDFIEIILLQAGHESVDPSDIEVAEDWTEITFPEQEEPQDEESETT